MPINPIVFSQNTFGLAPEVFNAVDMIFTLDEFLRVVYSLMNKGARVKDIIRPVTVGVNNAVWLDFLGILKASAFVS